MNYLADNENDEITRTEMYPDWNLIDEVSLPLLEQGIARFDTLQALLPSLMTIDTSNIKEDHIEKLPKLLRIAQMQVEHMLRSQHKLTTELEEMKIKLDSIKRHNRALKTKLEQKEDEKYFQCFSCVKCFITQEFLAKHIQERHSNKS